MIIISSFSDSFPILSVLQLHSYIHHSNIYFIGITLYQSLALTKIEEITISSDIYISFKNTWIHIIVLLRYLCVPRLLKIWPRAVKNTFVYFLQSFIMRFHKTKILYQNIIWYLNLRESWSVVLSFVLPLCFNLRITIKLQVVSWRLMIIQEASMSLGGISNHQSYRNVRYGSHYHHHQMAILFSFK